MAETLQNRRAINFKVYKQVLLKLIHSIIILFLVRLFIVIIYAVALYVTDHHLTDVERKNLTATAMKYLPIYFENEDYQPSEVLLNSWKNKDNTILKQCNTPNKNKQN